MTGGRRPGSSGLRLPPNPRTLPPATPCRVLAVSGGGYRGLYSAELLRLIELDLQPGRPSKPAPSAGPQQGDPARSEPVLADRFELFSGTSAGGLVAAGLAIGRSAEDVRDAIRSHGPRIFDDRFMIANQRMPFRKPTGPVGGLFGAKFSRAALEVAIDEVLGADGKDMKVAEVPRPLLLIATCATSKAPYLMSNLEPDQPGAKMTLRNALIATAAAPGYFPSLDLPNRTLVDGGLVANAPELAALSLLKRHRPAAVEQFRIMSVGTAGSNPASIPEAVGSKGLLRWLLGDLVPLTLEAQERLIVRSAEDILGRNYWRLNAPPSPKQAGVLALDRATSQATRTLLHLAEETHSRLDKDRVQEWLSMKAESLLDDQAA